MSKASGVSRPDGPTGQEPMLSRNGLGPNQINGLEPQLTADGWGLAYRHARLLQRLPGVADAAQSPSPAELFWQLWLAALRGSIGVDSRLKLALSESSDWVAGHLPSDAVGQVRTLVAAAWQGSSDDWEPRRTAVLPGLLELLRRAAAEHPHAAELTAWLAELAALPGSDFELTARWPAVLSAVERRRAGADDGRNWQTAIRTRPSYLWKLLAPQRADELADRLLAGARLTALRAADWSLDAALTGADARAAPVLDDVETCLLEWLANCPPGAPQRAGLRVPFGVLAQLPCVPGLRLLRLALERLTAAAHWGTGAYDSTAVLTQTVRRAVWRPEEGEAAARAALAEFRVGPDGGRPCSRRQALLRLAVLNPLFTGVVERSLHMPGLTEMVAWIAGIEWDSDPADRLHRALASALAAQVSRPFGSLLGRSELLRLALGRISPDSAMALLAEFAACHPFRAGEQVRRIVEGELRRLSVRAR